MFRSIQDLTTRERLLIEARGAYSQQMSTLADKLAAIRDVVEVLESTGTAYALIGGIAVGVHSGVPRATLDVDIAVRSDVHRRDQAKALIAAGFRLVGEFPHSLNFRHGSGEPVQLAIDPAFDPMLDRAETIEVDDLRIRIVTRDDLITMKRRAASDPGHRRSKALRDQADLALLLGDVPDPDEGW